MKPTLAIARLTIWEGVRMGIVLVFVAVLAAIVVAAPFVLSGDGTLAGRLQNVLNWSLSSLALLLSLATVFMSCSTLATEIQDCSIHLVVTKPVTRFQILAGKWIGINMLNLLLLTLCGAVIYGFATVVKNRPALNERDRLKIDNVVWTARTGATPVIPPELASNADAWAEQKIEQGAVSRAGKAAAVRERRKELVTQWRVIKPGSAHVYYFENLRPPTSDSVVQVRFKARGQPPPLNDMLSILWNLLDPESGRGLQAVPRLTERRSGDIHHMLVRTNAIRDGRAAVMVINPEDVSGRTSIVFDGEDSLQLLYSVSSFEDNFVKTLLLILMQLCFLSAVGLLFGAFVSFPIACLCVCVTYAIGLLHPWWMVSIGADLTIRTDAIDPFGAWGPAVRFLLVPLLQLFPNLVRFNGAALLVEGEYISWRLLGECALRTLAYGGALLLVVGWMIFRRREIAEVTV